MAWVALATALVVAMLSPVVAWANDDDPCGHRGPHFRGDCAADRGAGSVEFGVRVVDLSHVSGGERRSSGGGPPPCSFEAVAEGWDRNYHLVDQTGIPMAARFYWIVCDERRYLRWYLPGDTDPVADGLITELVQEAFDRIHTTPPALTLSPAADRFQLTGVPTWLAIHPDSWQTPTGSVSAGGITIDAWLEPRHIDWDLGNGDHHTCTTPGNVYDTAVAYEHQSPDCSYTYTTTPAHLSGAPDATTFTVAATVTYTAYYQVTGLPGLAATTYSLGDIDGPPATTPIEVRELRAVRTTTP